MFKIPNLFGNQPQPAAPAPVVQQQPVQTTQQQPQATSGSVMIDQSKQGTQGNQPKEKSSPLEPFADLWNDKPKELTEGNQPAPVANPRTPAKTSEPDFAGFAGKVDFSRVFAKNPELVQKALGGDVAAFGQVMNSIVQASYAAALKSSHSMIGAREKVIRESIISELPQHFKSLSVQNSGYSNPAFKHPAMKPLVDATKQQFLQKFPDATPAEIDTQVEQYLAATFEAAGFAKTANASGKGKVVDAEIIDQTTNSGRMQAQVEGQFDWTKDFGLEVPNPS